MNNLLILLPIITIGLVACSAEKNDPKPNRSAYQQQYIHTCMKPTRGTAVMKAKVEHFCACTYDVLLKEYGSEQALMDTEKPINQKNSQVIKKLEQASQKATMQCKQHLPQ